MVKRDVAAKKASAPLASRTDREGVTTKKICKSAMPINQSLSNVATAVNTAYANYLKTLTPRLKLIDAFLVFLVALGVLQFLYVLLVGNFPFNSFLGGFISCVGQFVLTVSLRMQYALHTSARNTADKDADTPFPTITPERALGDFVFASLVLHFIVFHFIN